MTCANCANLEIWPGLFASRYLCSAYIFKHDEQPKWVGQYGRPCSKGEPVVKSCQYFEPGRHYSRKQK